VGRSLDMARDVVAVAVPRAQTCVEPGFFGRHFTVRLTQTYEVVYTLSSPTEACSVQKRYRQFRELRDSLDSSTLPTFPEKLLFKSRKSAVIEERRGLLQAWLQAILSSPQLKPHLTAFLGVSLPSNSTVSWVSSEEQSVLDFLSRVESDPRMKLSSLTVLDTSLFSGKAHISLPYLQRLIDLLTLLSADYLSGCKAISVLSKLLSREMYRDHETVQAEWLALGPERLRAMGLDLHLMRLMCADTREEAFHLFKIIYDLWLPMGKAFLMRIVSDLDSLMIINRRFCCLKGGHRGN